MIKIVIILLCGAVVGGFMGYLGKCQSGQCPLTSNPYRGAVFGMLIAGFAAFPLLMNALKKPLPKSPDVIYLKNSEDLKGLIDSDKLCLVDFYADWCGPCQNLSPTIDQLAKEFKSKINVVKVNVDSFPELASQYGAVSIPTVLFFKNSKELTRSVGVQDYDYYVNLINKE